MSIYHARPHDSLIDPAVPGLRMSPSAMFEHGIARAGYIEVPRAPELGFEFLPVEWRTIQHYGVEIGGRRYNSDAVNAYRAISSSHKRMRGKWPFAVNPEDITRIFFRDPPTAAGGH